MSLLLPVPDHTLLTILGLLSIIENVVVVQYWNRSALWEQQTGLVQCLLDIIAKAKATFLGVPDARHRPLGKVPHPLALLVRFLHCEKENR